MEQQNFNIHQSIIDRCLSGDRLAFYELYKLYSKAMYNVCLRMVKDTNDAEDVLQEAFTSAFKNLKSYNAEASFGAWLKRIVINKSLNFIKKRGLNLSSLDDVKDLPEEQANTDFSDSHLTVNRVLSAMEKLPDGYRLVFSLYLIEGYDHNEIGQILGITESTSKSQFNRSKKKLRQLLKANG